MKFGFKFINSWKYFKLNLLFVSTFQLNDIKINLSDLLSKFSDILSPESESLIDIKIGIRYCFIFKCKVKLILSAVEVQINELRKVNTVLHFEFK